MKDLLILLSGALVLVSGGDFKKDCADGEFCGSCDFELHSCGWNDSSAASYGWRRQRANISSVPGEDHTSNSPFGHVMHINGTGAGMFSKAILDYVVDQQAALACQMSFWYHIFNEEAFPSSSKLQVQLIRGSTEEELLHLSVQRTNGWANATVFIGNKPPGYKLRFKFEPGYMSVVDVMLDDIKMEYCGEADIPPESEHLSCHFENNTCSWYHDYTAALLWKRSGTELADSRGKYMIIEAAKNLPSSSAARLKSIQQPANQVLCVSFRYLIFGNSIGSLRFISQRSGEPQTVMWKRSGTQGNKWRFADLTFNSDKPVQFTIEAIRGGDQGSIAIDDIEVTRSDDGSCPPERECTFQGSLCGLQSQPSEFTWNRMTGASQPANYTGPIADHTLGTDQGYYLSAQLWRHPEGSRVPVMTAPMEPTPAHGECLLFWYHMAGSGVGELSVSLQSNDGAAQPAQLWTRKGDQGVHWRHGRVTLLSPDTPYQVIFEAKVGDAQMRDIAIDDLTVHNDACPPAGFCDFEMDFCGWVNSPPPESGVDWDWLSGGSAGKLVPSRDHTTNSALGHFATFLSTINDNEMIAQLESESMEPVDEACLELWHYGELWGPHSEHLTLTVLLNESAGLRPVWNMSGISNKIWTREMVDYSSPGPHQIVLQARSTGLQEESLSLDDIHIIRNKSCSDLIVTTTSLPPSTPTTTAAPPSSMDCYFEEGLCNWIQEEDDDSDWTRTQGVEVEQPWDGPLYDHTVENNQGFFLLLNGPGSKNEERAVISVPITKRSSQICVGFWFYMLGPSVSRLDLLVQEESSARLLWTRHGTQNPEWTKALVTISVSNTMQPTLKLAGYRNTQSRGFIAVDDVTVREGVCPEQDGCGFDSGLCGFENDQSHRGRWEPRRGTAGDVDHTYGTENGFYMTVMSNSTQPEVAELLSKEYAASERMCVRFWYQLSAGSTNDLAVHVLRSGELGEALWQRRGSPTDGWEVAEVTVFSPLQFHVVFRTALEPGSKSTVKLDDYSVRDGACSPPAACDFESGQCSWVNVPQEDGHNWVLSSGGFQGPSVEHTIDTSQGWFMLSSARHKSHSSVAQLTSEWIRVEDGTSCLSLWHHMESSHSGTLRVFKRSRPSEDELIFTSESSGSVWRRLSKSVETSQPFQLLVEANSENRGFIAIDDIALTPGPCPVNESSSVFVGCSFENGTCDWEDVSVGQGLWVRGRNASGNTGPSVDHTLGTQLGWYVAVDENEGDQLSPAALRSPALKQASADCTLHFYYNMFGAAVEDLKVLLNEGSRMTPLWWLSGNHEDSWQLGEVTVGRVLRDFSIVFEASRTFNQRGHIALDDVDFLNCSLPVPQPSCPDTMFRCNNSVCVRRGAVCDFRDDCGDWSDENNCEQQGVLERCSFEQGLCFWESDEDGPGGGWRIVVGQEGWPGQGPPRDHTQNSAAGHYVVPGTHLETGQTSEMTSRTLLPSLDCTVRFFYFSLNNAASGLTARLRSQRSAGADVVLQFSPKSHGYSWQRAEVTFSSSSNSKIVFSYEAGSVPGGLVALDDITFSRGCVLDPANSQLPDTPPTPPTPGPSVMPSTSMPPVNPCKEGEFFCWQSAENVCIQEASRCDYRADCPRGEDEEGCGPCTFETGQCRWTGSSDGLGSWQRLRASSGTQPPSDHTTGTGYYMRGTFSPESGQSGATLQSPVLPPPSPYCQMLFHFHISAASAGSLTVLMQQAGGSEAILWSRSHNTVSHWIPEHLPVGLQQPYKVWFSYLNGNAGDSSGDSAASGVHVAAVDDISFVNCEKSYQPPVLSTYGCSFEQDLCTWVQGAEDDLDWLVRSGPTDTLNTGPAGDHTTGTGQYLHIESSPPSEKGNKAQLKSLLLPPAGEKGYCVTFWYHMFGPTVGSLKMFLQTVDRQEKTLVWQRSGNQEDEWRAARTHVTLQKVHQVILEAAVAGQGGDVAVDDVSFAEGPCATSAVCDFEEGSCNWQQDTSDDADWLRQSGNASHPGAAPQGDHTTDTAAGHYYYLPSLPDDRAGQRAAMVSPLHQSAGKTCVQLWYHMSGDQVGTLNVYQQSEGGQETLIFSQAGNQGRLWRLAQSPLDPKVHPYRVVVEGVKAGPAQEGGIALDDLTLTDAQCPPPGFCDFESGMCRWSNHAGGADQGDWLRGRGASTNPSSGPSVDHTTNSSQGYYVYVDSSVGQWGDVSYLASDVLQPSTRGHCLTFWYRIYGEHVGTLKVYLKDWSMPAGGTEEGALHWIEAENGGERWHRASVYVKHPEAFWFVFVYQKGKSTTGDVALDDITITPHSCFADPPPPPQPHDGVSTGLIVGVTLLVGLVLFLLLFMLNRKWKKKNGAETLSNNQSSVFNLSDCDTQDAHHRTHSDLSFNNILYDAKSTDGTGNSSDA